MTIQFSDLKDGDVVKVTIAAHMATSRGLGGGPKVPKPETSRIVRVNWITNVNGQPGRRQAWCHVLVTEKGQDLRGMLPSMAPGFSFYDPQLPGNPAITIERAE
jgi:hypothetical protein